MIEMAVVGTVGVIVTVILLVDGFLFREKDRLEQRRRKTLDGNGGLVRQEELSVPLFRRTLLPFLQKMSRVMSQLIPFAREDLLEEKALVAGFPGGLSAREWMVIKVLLASGAAMVLGLVLGRGQGPAWQAGAILFLGVSLGWFAPDLWLGLRGSSRQEEVERALPDMLDLLTVSVEAGLGFEGALARIIEKTQGVLADEMRIVLEETRMGKGRGDALRDMARRLQSDSLSNFVASIVMAEGLGVSIANVLRVQSQEMRDRKRQRAREIAMKAPIKMLIPMVMFIFPAIFVVLLGPAFLQIMKIFG